MIKISRADTPICFMKGLGGTDSKGFDTDIDLSALVPLDGVTYFCEWKNRFGQEARSAASDGIKEPARLRMYYVPEVDDTMYVKRLSDEAIFEVVSCDDVEQRHIILEMEIKRYVSG